MNHTFVAALAEACETAESLAGRIGLHPKTVARWANPGSNGGDCVEVADNLPGVVGVRDSKDPAGPALTFSRGSWRAFVTQVAGRS